MRLSEGQRMEIKQEKNKVNVIRRYVETQNITQTNNLTQWQDCGGNDGIEND